MVLPGCVSMVLENRPILKCLNEKDVAPYLIKGICVFYDLEIYPYMDNYKLVPSIIVVARCLAILLINYRFFKMLVQQASNYT